MHVIPIAGKENRYKVLTDDRHEASRIADTLNPMARFGLKVVAKLCRPGRVPTFGADTELLVAINRSLDPPCPNLDRFVSSLDMALSAAPEPVIDVRIVEAEMETSLPAAS